MVRPGVQWGGEGTTSYPGKGCGLGLMGKRRNNLVPRLFREGVWPGHDGEEKEQPCTQAVHGRGVYGLGYDG